ncbi:MAG: hypothetical protein HY815_18375 [Candidatus Riflebacteria bacterium]|nr:hypothetical protein [Candidatus Riflebacteria bacterium]
MEVVALPVSTPDLDGALRHRSLQVPNRPGPLVIVTSQTFQEAICAATGYLARLGLLDHVAHTSDSLAFLNERAPGYAGEALYRDQLAVRDSGVVTASGLGAVEFTFEILSALDLGTPSERDAWFRAFKHGEALALGHE